ncbi:MAG: M14 family zinc carboxypeptidase [Gemmatimonadales bacterium]
MRALVPVLCLLTAPLPLAAQQHAAAFDFYTRGPYRSAVPRPEAITGYPAGEWHTQYAVLQQYLDTILATAGDRVRIEHWGETVEGRPIRALIISDPTNLARLEEIRAGVAELADPRRTSPSRAAQIASTSPAVAVFHYSVHGDEPAGYEASMQVIYQLAASEEPQTLALLKALVVVINPSANPDGHERFAVWYNSIAVGSDHFWSLEFNEPWGITGRYSHYRFDMNRDLLAQTQPAVRAMMAGVMRWRPQVFVDHHSTTQTFFFPPVAQAVNLNLPAQTTRWFDVYGRGNAAAFDRHGWQYFVRGVFDFFYIGYWDEWSTFQGATGMTYESDGGPEFNRRRDDGTISTFRDGIAHHFVASMATLETTARHRQARLVDYYEFRRSAMAEAARDPMKRVVIVPDRDPAAAAQVVTLLLRSGVEVSRLRQSASSRAAHPFLGGAAGSRTFPAGSYVIDLGQPQRRIAKAMLEPDAELQRDFVEREVGKFQRNRRRGEDADREDYGFYDITAWSLPYTFNLDAYWTEDAGAITAESLTDTTALVPRVAPPAEAGHSTAYVFTNTTGNAARLALALQREGFRLAVASQPVRADGRAYPRGTFIARVQRNPAGLGERLGALGAELGVAVTAVRSAFPDSGDVGIGSGDVGSLRPARILVAGGDGVSQTSYGWLWYFLERELHAPFTPIVLRAIGSMRDLYDYNVLVIPDGSGSRMRRELGEGGVERLKAWVRSGGVVIGFGGAWELAAHEDVGLSTIAAVGADSGARADTAASGTVPALVSATAPPRDRPEWIPGAIFRATLDPTHWLTFGYEGRQLPVFIEGDTFWEPSRGGANPVVLTGDALLLSGFAWPGNTERLLQGTAWAVVENHGSGHAVLFLSDPLFRGFWRGTARLFTNALLFGPGR